MKINQLIQIINYLNDCDFFNLIYLENEFWENYQLILNFIGSYYLDKMMNPFFFDLMNHNLDGFLIILFSLIKTTK